MVVTNIWVRTTVQGFHNWPQPYKGREYLADRHRHLFHVEVEVPVSHDDRDIEFHDLLDEVNGWLRQFRGEFGPRSCEAIARELGKFVLLSHPIGTVKITVSEDGEAGAVVVLERAAG